MQSFHNHLTKRKESICPHKDLYTNVHSNFICDSHKLKIARMFVSRRMGKQNVVYPCNVILLSNKKDEHATAKGMMHARAWLQHNNKAKSIISY